MIKKILLLLFVILATSFCATATSWKIIETYAKPGEASCYINGQVMIPVTQHKPYYYLDQIGFITAVHQETGDYIYITGKWYDKEFEETSTILEGENVYLISDEYLLNDKTSYEIHLSRIPLEAVSLVDEVDTIRYNVTCPGYQHSCKYIDLRIEECFSDDDYFYAYFNGVGELHYSKVDIYKDINYSLNYQAFSDVIGYLTPMPSSFTIEELGGDRYFLRIPRKDLREDINQIKLHVSGCIEGFYNVAAFKKCYFKGQIQPKQPPQIQDTKQETKQLNVSIVEQEEEQKAPENIDFVYKIIAFFKRLFGFGKR